MDNLKTAIINVGLQTDFMTQQLEKLIKALNNKEFDDIPIYRINEEAILWN